MILAVGNIKGGVGKTMLAVNIAAALALRGREVLLVDADDQASAATFAQIRADHPSAAKLTTVQLEGKAIRTQVRQLSEKYDEVVIDVGGRVSESLGYALTVADALLVPFQPRSVDLWTAEQIVRAVDDTRSVNEALKVFVVLNIADAQGRDNDDAMTALSGLDGVTVLPSPIIRRKAFPNAFSAGLSVMEQSPRDQKACGEILSVVNAMYAQEVDNDH